MFKLGGQHAAIAVVLSNADFVNNRSITLGMGAKGLILIVFGRYGKSLCA